MTERPEEMLGLPGAREEAQREELLRTLRCAFPAVVQAYDRETQTVDVLPAVRGGEAPLLRQVPVFFPGGRTAALTYPIAPGDECLVIVADACVDGWLETGQPGPPPLPRTHDLSDAFAFVGFRSRPNALRQVPDQPSFFGREGTP